MTPPREWGKEAAGRTYLTALATAAAVVTLDLWTKRWAATTLTAEPAPVLGTFLELVFVENTGAAFSMFEGGGSFFGPAAIVAFGAVLWFLRNAKNGFEVTSFGLIMGGAVGNLIDRIARGPGWFDGPVIDWIGLWVIPTFNVADASITVAVALLFLSAWTSD